MRTLLAVLLACLVLGCGSGSSSTEDGCKAACARHGFTMRHVKQVPQLGDDTSVWRCVCETEGN